MDTSNELFSAGNNLLMLLMLMGAFVAGFSSAFVIRRLVPRDADLQEFFVQWVRKLSLLIVVVSVGAGVLFIAPHTTSAIEEYGFPLFLVIVLSLAATIFMVVWGLLCGTEHRVVSMKELFSAHYFLGGK